MPPTRVKRSLFGRPQSGKVKTELQDELERLTTEGKKRWNFDFRTDSPVKGRIEWHATSVDDEDLPAFYAHTESPIKLPCASQVTPCLTNQVGDTTASGEYRLEKSFKVAKSEVGLSYIREMDIKDSFGLDIAVQTSPGHKCFCQELKTRKDHLSLSDRSTEVNVLDVDSFATESKVT